MNNVIAFSTHSRTTHIKSDKHNNEGKKALHTLKLLHLLLKTNYQFEEGIRKKRMTDELQLAVNVLENYVH